MMSLNDFKTFQINIIIINHPLLIYVNQGNFPHPTRSEISTLFRSQVSQKTKLNSKLSTSLRRQEINPKPMVDKKHNPSTCLKNLCGNLVGKILKCHYV